MWPNRRSVAGKLLLGYSAIVLSLTISITWVLQTSLRSTLEDETLQHIDTRGELIVAELVRKATLVNTLTQSMVNLAASATEPSILRDALPKMINLSHSEAYIAGGGYWPEPFAFDKTLERSSFFWGREQDGSLKFYDDYNDLSGSGYHHEEWYVPAQYLNPGNCYWSRSYTDPYSGQPMVTCTVAALDQGAFVGAATIDLKLEGLDELLEEHTKLSGGYAFIVDQHNRFISFPESSWVVDEQNSDRITVRQLAEKQQGFASLSEALDAISIKHFALASNKSDFDVTIAEALDRASYQISSEEAKTVAMALNDPVGERENFQPLLARLEIDSDLMLQEPTTASIYHVPDSYWKVVLVTPQRIVDASVQSSIKDVWITVLAPLLVIMAIAFVGLKYSLLKPIKRMTESLKQSAENESLSFVALDEDRGDEFGQLAYWYNKKSVELNQALQKLSELNVELNLHAHFDPLTNLSNRRDFAKALTRLIETESWEAYGLLYIDLDQFKLINDTCGHVAGDKLLIQISEVLKSLTRKSDMVSRIGGDEFAIIVRLPDRNAVCLFADRVVKAVADIKFRWEQYSFNVACSIGALHLSEVDRDFTLAMKMVDTACYSAKESGRNRFHLFHQDEVSTRHTAEMSWISRINNAMEKHRFATEFQLIAPTRNQENDKYCLEALVRMIGENGKLIPPGAFMPAAERYNVVSRIDRWVIQHALEEVKSITNIWDRINYVSINVSGDSISSEGFFKYVEETLENSGVSPECVCFEVTETQVISNIDKAIKCLFKLRKLGCLIALDDFGSGMSSYGYLEELPVNFLKIDGSFVKDMRDNKVHYAFVESMGKIANAMNIKTIAEFVEDIETYNALGEIGINYAQGFGIAKPQSLLSTIELIDQKKRRNVKV